MSKGNIIGIDVDVAAALADQLGLKLQLVDTAGQNSDNLLSSGAIDIIMGLEQSNGLVTPMHYVGPYLLDGPALFTVSVSSTPVAVELSTLVGTPVTAQKDSLSAWTLGGLIGNSSVVTVASMDEVFDQLVTGAVNYAASDAILGTFLAVDYDDVVCTQIIGTPIGVYIGIPASNEALTNTITDATRTIRDNGVLKLLVTKWLGPRASSVVLTDQAIVVLGGTSTQTTTVQPSDTPTDTGEDLPDPALAGGN
jgi:polar amino acid transport system substrate-binding protein